jgi:hypothetical protein
LQIRILSADVDDVILWDEFAGLAEVVVASLRRVA